MASELSLDPALYFITCGTGSIPFVWGHGWGQSHHAFAPLANALNQDGQHTIVDFPGFGQTPPPPDSWGSAEYADHIACFIKSRTNQPVLWIGHSFGCRVGIQLAARYPDLVKGLCLIAAAGLPPKRPFLKKTYIKSRIRLYKFLKKLIPFGLPESWLIKRFASPDYQNAGPLRKILTRVVNEDLSAQARTITCPVLLLYGSEDTETPPEIGERLHALIPQSERIVLKGFDHYSILREAQHQVLHRIKEFISKKDTVS